MLAFFNNHLDRTILLKGIHNLFLTVARITDLSASETGGYNELMFEYSSVSLHHRLH